MNPGPLILISLSAIALLAVPRRWAPLPFIMTACYLSIEQAIDVGPFTFTALRFLIVVGIVRVMLRGERLVGGMNGLDWWMLGWTAWAVASGMFHENPGDTLVNRLGLVYNAIGIYALLRIFCTSIEDVIGLCRATAILLIPVAIEMVYEMRGAPSLFYVLEGRPNPVYAREERIRAFGPFVHPILAGTVGAVCIPQMVGMWKHRRKTAVAGLLACVAMIVSSASSGPILSAVTAVGALAMWPLRYRMRTARWLAVLLYLALALAMNAPVYYLIARIDMVDGSTGYHRALLIDSAITNISEWWIAGTDYTRHWAPSAGPTAQHTDITNQYIGMGVLGGLPLMLLFIAALDKAFSIVGLRLREEERRAGKNQFMLWALGSALFAHAVTFLSVSYFDQSFMFVYMTLGAIGSAHLRKESSSVVPHVAMTTKRWAHGWLGPRHGAPRTRPLAQPPRFVRREM